MTLLLLPYDTETTGIPLHSEPSEDPRQPHIVSVCAALVTFDGVPADTLNAIVRPDGWTIPDEAAKVHGITTERAMDEGQPEAEVLEQLLLMHERAAMRIGFNEAFDGRIVRIAIKRFALLTRPKEEREALAERWSESAAYCTMWGARAAMGLKKNPKLADAFKHFTGRELENAHDAMQDARANWTVYNHLRALGIAPGNAEQIAEQLRAKLKGREKYKKPAPAPLGDDDIVGL